jgi:ketosteroid isomerase-like protein
MKRLPVLDEDRRSIAAWFETWAARVAAVDFSRVREMFTEDAIAFGSKVEMMTSRASLEQEQWRSVWPTMEDYRYDISTLEITVSPDRLMAMDAAIFHSTGLHADKVARFDRPGRATATLMRERVDAPWYCTHTHVSLKPGTPTPSHFSRPEAT